MMTVAPALWVGWLLGGSPQVLVLPLQGSGLPGDMEADATSYALGDALERAGHEVVRDPEGTACATDVCAVLEGRAMQVTLVLYGSVMEHKLTVHCVSVDDGERVGEKLDVALTGDWADAVARVVPTEEEPPEVKVPLLWGRAGTLIMPKERYTPTENTTLRVLGGIASGVAFTGMAAGLGILGLAAASGTLLPAYATLGNAPLVGRVALYIAGAVGAAGAALLAGLLLATMPPLLLVGVVLLLWAGVLD